MQTYPCSRFFSSIDFVGLVYERVYGSNLRVRIARVCYTGELTGVVHWLSLCFNFSCNFMDRV